MKKFLLLTSLLASSFAITNAQITQCWPDQNYTPTSPTGAGIMDLECAKTNVLYQTSTTIVIPTVVSIPINGTTTSVRICSVQVNNIVNWPAYNNAPNWAIWEQGNQYAAGQWVAITQPNITRACVSIEALFTAPYNDSVVVEGNAKVSLDPLTCGALQLEVPFSEIDQDNGGLPIAFVVADDCTYSVEETLSNNSFDVAQNYPNPVDGSSQIMFNVPSAGKVNFRVTNLLGSVVAEKQINATPGKNTIDIASGSFASGVYMYSITFNGQTITKRMIVK